MIHKTLAVYLNSDLVGQLHQDLSGKISFQYDPSFLKTSSLPISISLPLQEGMIDGNVVRAFFSGLLPDESVRQRVARYIGISDKNSFGLLEAIGGDCAGALSLYPPDLTPQDLTVSTQDQEVLDNDRLVKILEIIKKQPFLVGEEKMRLSLAGAQNKLAVGFQHQQVLLIKGNSPTTHILKPMMEHVKDSVYNELFCMKLAKRVGINVPEVHLYFAHDIPCYIVERYDRIAGDKGQITRLHQEDFCQALGILPEIKYEREGGPSISKCQEIIANYSARPAADQLNFLQLVLFNYMIGNADAHGKNFSLLYKKGTQRELSPAYDLLSTAVYPDLSEKMAMKIGSKYLPEELLLRDWYQLVPNTKSAQNILEKQLMRLGQKTLEQSLKLRDELAQKNIKSDILDAICALIEQRVNRVLNY